mmetsp:Transcript_14472/g.30970  ORF Transcript_14472/g.30970 Transcript_14472/m.30970 type:complete len:236 (+) Transcript_14472:892-1599(+)
MHRPPGGEHDHRGGGVLQEGLVAKVQVPEGQALHVPGVGAEHGGEGGEQEVVVDDEAHCVVDGVRHHRHLAHQSRARHRAHPGGEDGEPHGLAHEERGLGHGGQRERQPEVAQVEGARDGHHPAVLQEVAQLPTHAPAVHLDGHHEEHAEHVVAPEGPGVAPEHVRAGVTRGHSEAEGALAEARRRGGQKISLGLHQHLPDLVQRAEAGVVHRPPRQLHAVAHRPVVAAEVVRAL